jgi:hypothetical protein
MLAMWAPRRKVFYEPMRRTILTDAPAKVGSSVIKRVGLNQSYHIPVFAMASYDSGVKSTTSAIAIRHCKAISSSDATRLNPFMVG